MNRSLQIMDQLIILSDSESELGSDGEGRNFEPESESEGENGPFNYLRALAKVFTSRPESPPPSPPPPARSRKTLPKPMGLIGPPSEYDTRGSPKPPGPPPQAPVPGAGAPRLRGQRLRGPRLKGPPSEDDTRGSPGPEAQSNSPAPRLRGPPSEGDTRGSPTPKPRPRSREQLPNPPVPRARPRTRSREQLPNPPTPKLKPPKPPKAPFISYVQPKIKTLEDDLRENQTRLDNLVKSLKTLTFPSSYENGIAKQPRIRLKEKDGEFNWASRAVLDAIKPHTH